MNEMIIKHAVYLLHRMNVRETWLERDPQYLRGDEEDDIGVLMATLRDEGSESSVFVQRSHEIKASIRAFEFALNHIKLTCPAEYDEALARFHDDQVQSPKKGSIGITRELNRWMWTREDGSCYTDKPNRPEYSPDQRAGALLGRKP